MAVTTQEPVDVLARRYRTLLSCYPTEYRHERGDELLDTLLAAARPGQRWPSLPDAADLMSHAARRRLRTDATPGLAAGLTVAGPIALSLAAGLAAFLWIGGEIAPDASRHLGPFRTLGPIAYAAWLVATAGNAALPSMFRRDLIAGAVLVTALLPVAALLTGIPRPPLWVMASLVLYGLVALTGSAATSPVRIRRAALAGAGATALLPTLALYLWVPRHAAATYYGIALVLAGAVVAIALAVLAATGLLVARRRRSSRHWWWALLLLALPGTWLVSVDLDRGWYAVAPMATPALGRLGQFVLAASAVVAAMVWMARKAARARPAGSARGLAGAAAVACGVGLSGVVWLTMPTAGLAVLPGAWLVAAAGWAFLPVRPAQGLVAGALAVTAGLPLVGAPAGHGVPLSVTAVLAALGVIAMLDARVSNGARYGVAAGALAVLAAALVVGAYDHNWQVGTWRHLLPRPELVAALALVPLLVGVVAGQHTARHASGGQALCGMAVLAASAAGIGYLILPHPLALAAVPVGLAYAGVVVALSYAARRRLRTLPAGGQEQ
jgi:hypothetical protein